MRVKLKKKLSLLKDYFRFRKYNQILIKDSTEFKKKYVYLFYTDLFKVSSTFFFYSSF